MVIITTYMQRIFLIGAILVITIHTLPLNFTWGPGGQRNYLTPTQNQNNPSRCESGWAWSTINSLNTRINIKIAKAGLKWPLVSLSTQVLLECDQFDFGCLGGEPSQALKWIKKHNITDSTCNPYKARGYTNGQICSSQSKCQVCTSKNNCTGQSNSKIYSLERIGSVSGQYEMTQEIYNNGPVVCGLAVTNQLRNNYTGGVFVDKTGVYNYNHYVSVIGWGQTANQVKYWIVQNSFGPTWGEQGYFRILRGANNLGIQNLCFFGVPADTWTNDIRNKTLPNSVLELKPTVAAQTLNLPAYLTPSHSHMTPNYCDSSWAFSVVQALADATSIKSNGQISKLFSVQALLNCGVGNCQTGGNPFDALAFIHKYGIPEEGCQQYQAMTPNKVNCSAVNNCASCGGNSIFKATCSEVKGYKRWYIADYGSVAGQANMKIQLQNHQALICGIELTHAFRDYKGGIFSQTTVSPKINHYVEIIGYGSQSGQSYWLGRSSFGTSWGLSGFFKIKAGSANLGVQTNCHWAGTLL